MHEFNERDFSSIREMKKNTEKFIKSTYNVEFYIATKV